MKQSLSLKQGQHLAMTPQLQQAIKLLQLSSLELQQEITRALDENPMLEREEELERDEPMSAEPTNENPSVESVEVAIETDWSDTNYFEISRPITQGGLDDDGDTLEHQRALEPSLQEHLRWQLNLLPLTERDQLIAEVLVDSINADGFLECDLHELRDQFDGAIDDLEEDELLCVLHQIQQLDPIGVGSRTLQECLLLQLNHLRRLGGDVGLALTLVEHHLDAVSKQDRAQLMRLLRCDNDTLELTLALIRTLDPKPGSRIGGQSVGYIIPDLIVRHTQTGWMVELNPEAVPRIAVSDRYQHLIARGDTSETNTYLQGHLQEARWLVKSLKSRAETLLKVGSCIVEAQQAFFRDGPTAMKPLVLADIARQVDMHESTISRVTTQKFMATPRGTFELKYFFSSHVGTDDGGEASSTAIKAHLQALIKAEDPARPLSDQKLSDLLADAGFQVARRTVAKYRELLGFAGSSDRKRVL